MINECLGLSYESRVYKPRCYPPLHLIRPSRQSLGLAFLQY